jgi:hypothetical protein
MRRLPLLLQAPDQLLHCIKPGSQLRQYHTSASVLASQRPKEAAEELRWSFLDGEI